MQSLRPTLQNEAQYCILILETTPALLWWSATKQRLAATKNWNLGTISAYDQAIVTNIGDYHKHKKDLS